MAEALVLDWLGEFEQLEPSQLKSFIAQTEENHEITTALFAVLGERDRVTEVSQKICTQFHSFYKSGVTELRRFTLQFLPIIVYNYLNAVSQGDKRGSRHFETLLIAIYNIEISNDVDGKPKVISFRMPILAQASIYHEEKSLHPTDLRRWEENCNKTVNWGPLPHVEHLNAQNRLKVITALLFIYNQQLSQIQKPTLYHLCRIASQLVNQGFAKFERPHRSYGSANDFHNSVEPAAASSIPSSKALPRIPVSAELLLELTHAAYFVMFNEFASVAIRTIKDIHRRACFEMLPNVILVTGAVKNSLHANPSGQPSDGPMGISVALTPATTTVTVSKSMITNASFRAKKLPDDIPIQLSKDEKGGGGGSGASGTGASGNPGSGMNSSTNLDSSNQLQSINEEGESMDGQQMPTAAHLARNTPGRQSKEFTAKLHKVSFPNFKKLKDKDSKKSSSGAIPLTEMGGSKKDLHESGQSTGSSSSGMSAPIKRASILKDKLINRNSMPSDSVDSGNNVEKVTVRLKNISLDSGTSSGAVVLMGSSGANSNNSFDLTESSSDPLDSGVATRPSILPLELSAEKPYSNGSTNGGGAGGVGGGGGGVGGSGHNNNVQVYQL